MLTDKRKVPDEFREIWLALRRTIQPRYLDEEAIVRYWDVLQGLPMPAIRRAAEFLKTREFWPDSGDWWDVALANWQPDYDGPLSFSEEAGMRVQVVEGSRTLEELDDLASNDPERDEICKRLSREDQVRLMARYGRAWR